MSSPHSSARLGPFLLVPDFLHSGSPLFVRSSIQFGLTVLVMGGSKLDVLTLASDFAHLGVALLLRSMA